jgi:hypothetical protein
MKWFIPPRPVRVSRMQADTHTRSTVVGKGEYG